MSIDIFLQCFRSGEPATFKRAIFEEIFGRHAIDPRPPFDDITYADGGAQIYGGEDEDIQSMMFNHCGGKTFFAALYELADRTRSVIFWPSGGSLLVVTNAETLDQLPQNFADENGSVRHVHDGEELAECIYGKR